MEEEPGGYVFGPETERVLRDLERGTTGRLWAAIMLAKTRTACCQIREGTPVRVEFLEDAVLRRAYRGRPHHKQPHDYLRVTREMLDAIAEGGPLASASS